ncbi:MAG TPA: TetR/AcrR family transcriptional regulator [Ilumatobacteraceae bacterium]|nr:TetR/AcrR family transcriptional regulator [Ilumatobacteraceae bacterium]
MTSSLAAQALPRRAGRPRSETTRHSILRATLHLLEDTTVQSLTIEAIAREAGVGKATIYRWWDSKALVVIDAFVEHHIVRTPMSSDLAPAEALAIHFSALVREYAGWSGRIVAQIIAEGQSDPTVLREFRERFHYGRRAVVREVLEQWRRGGSIPAPADIEVLADLIYAPVYMRLLLGHSPLDESFARSHLTYVYQLLGVQLPAIEAYQ